MEGVSEAKKELVESIAWGARVAERLDPLSTPKELASLLVTKAEG